jgi:acyl carrier protein
MEIEPSERVEMLALMIAELASEVMRTTSDNIDIQRPFAEMGIDSLMAAELQVSIEAKLGVRFPIFELTREGSVLAFARTMLGRLDVPTTHDVSEPVL